MVASTLLLPRSAGSVDRYRELAHVGPAFQGHDLGRAFPRHLIDTYDGMHGDEALLHSLELALELLLARVHHQAAALAEDHLFDLDEPPEALLAHLPGIDLVELALVHEDDFVDVTCGHGLAKVM